jgi:acetyl esterase/lipase
MISLWQTDIPRYRHDIPADIPALHPYLLPGRTPRGVVIVCPGGGYNTRVPHESEPIARWLNQIGLSAFVLDYRVKPYTPDISLLDAQRAIRYVRSHADEFGIDSHKIGLIGFSAGGHLAAGAGTHFDGGDPAAADPVERASSRPDALVLCYAVIDPRLFGRDETLPEEVINQFAHQNFVTAETPPTFLFHTSDDPVVPVEHSLLFASQLGQEEVPFSLHVFPEGPHGVSLAADRPVLAAWTKLCETWFGELGWLA